MTNAWMVRAGRRGRHAGDFELLGRVTGGMQP